VSEPCLHRANVQSIAQVISGERVPEFVQKEVHAIRPFFTLVAMLGHAASTVRTGTFSDALHDHIHFAVGIASGVAEDEIVGPGILALFPFLQPFANT